MIYAIIAVAIPVVLGIAAFWNGRLSKNENENDQSGFYGGGHGIGSGWGG